MANVDLGTVEGALRMRDEATATLSRVNGLLERVYGSGNAVNNMMGNIGVQAEVGLKSMLRFAGVNVAMDTLAGAFQGVYNGAIGMNATLETTTLQFATLMGSVEKAQAHVRGLFEFAKETPFETGPIIYASRQLQVFGGSALNTLENLRLFGDTSAATQAPIESLSFWIGRTYAMLKGGQPFGEAAMRLQELAVLTPEVRREMEKVAKSDPAKAWEIFTKSLEKNTGAMKKQAQTWQGVISTLSDAVSITAADVFRPVFESFRDAVRKMNDFWETDTFNSIKGSLKGFVADAVSIMQSLAGPVVGGIQKAWGILSDTLSRGEGFGILEKLRTDLLPNLEKAAKLMGDAFVAAANGVAKLKDAWDSAPGWFKDLTGKVIVLTAEVWLLQKAFVALGGTAVLNGLVGVGGALASVGGGVAALVRAFAAGGVAAAFRVFTNFTPVLTVLVHGLTAFELAAKAVAVAVAFLTNPVTLIIGGVIALTAAVRSLTGSWEATAKVMGMLIPPVGMLVAAWQGLKEHGVALWDIISKLAGIVKDVVVAAFYDWWVWIDKAWDKLKELWATVSKFASDVASMVKDKLSGFASWFKSILPDAVTDAMDKIAQFVAKVKGWFDDLLKKGKDTVDSAARIADEAAAGARGEALSRGLVSGRTSDIDLASGPRPDAALGWTNLAMAMNATAHAAPKVEQGLKGATKAVKKGKDAVQSLIDSLTGKNILEEAQKWSKALGKMNVGALSPEQQASAYKQLDELVKKLDQLGPVGDRAAAGFKKYLDQLKPAAKAQEDWNKQVAVTMTMGDILSKQLEATRAWYGETARVARDMVKAPLEKMPEVIVQFEELYATFGDLSKVVDENQLKQWFDAVNEAIRVQAGMGKDVPKAWSDIRDEIGAALGRVQLWRGQVVQVKKDTDGLTDTTGEALTATQKWAISLQTLSEAFANLAQVSGGSLGSVLGGIAKITNMANVAVQSVSGIKDGFSALGKGGFSNIMSGISGLAGGFASLAGLAMQVVEMFKKPGYKDVMKRVGRDWGVALSEELAKAIDEQAKKLFGGSRQAAEIFNFSKILSEAGGLSTANFETFVRKLRDAFSMKEIGKFSTEQFKQVLNEGFQAFATFLENSTEIAGKNFLELIELTRRFGVEIEAVTKFIEGQSVRIGTGLAAFAGPLLAQYGALGDKIEDAGKNVEEAKQALADLQAEFAGRDIGVEDAERLAEVQEALNKALAEQEALLAKQTAGAAEAGAEIERLGLLALAAFNGAMQSGVGYLAAVNAMGPSLDAIITLQENLGITGSNAAVQQLVAFRNLVNENKALVAATDALDDTMAAFANTGMLTADTFGLLQEQGLATFERLKKAGFDENQALSMMSDYLDSVLDAHEKLGVPIDENTQKLIDQAREAGVLKAAQKSATDVMREGFDKVVDAVDRLTRALGVDVPAAIAKIPTDVGVNVHYNVDPPLPLTGGSSPADYASFGAGVNQTINVEVDGQTIARASARNMPAQLDVQGF